MRSRNLKPEFFTNEHLLQCEPLARILFEGLWCMADRNGYLEDRPYKIKIKILPADNCDINSLLDQLNKHKLIIRYSVSGQNYIFIPKFSKHQHPHLNEKKSDIPCYNEPAPDSSGASTIAIRPLNESLLLNTSSYEEGSAHARDTAFRVDFQKLILIWNETLGELCPKIQRLTEQRKRLLANRLRDSFGGDDEQWRSYCLAIRGSPFCTGQNDRGWRANIDWALRPQAVAKVLEGFYAANETSTQNRQSKTNLAIEEASKLYA